MKRSRLHPNIWVLTLTSFLTDVSSEMVLNLVPLFLANVLGVRTAIIGLIEGIAETTASLTRLYSGRLSDRLGRRKWLTVLGYGLSTLAKPFLYFANSWGWVLGVRFADRLGKGIRTAPRDALIAGSTDPAERGFAFGLHRAGDTAGAFLGLAIATLLIHLSQADQRLLARETFQRVVLWSILPAALAVLILALGAREVPIAPAGAGSASRREGLDRRLTAFLVVIVLFTLGNSSDAFIILRAQERGLSLLQIMAMLLTFNLVYALFSTPFGSLSDRFGRRRLLLAGWFTYSLIYLGFALAQSGWQVWLLYGLYGLYYAANEGVARAFIADLIPDARRGTAYGLYNATVGLMALPASLLAGLLWQGVGSWQGFGAAAPFYFGALLSFLAAVLFWKWVR
ncbi:MAG: MFS transporter [Anaerolineales bacterium]